MQLPTLAIVVPCFNEEKVITETIKKLSAVLNQLEQGEKVSNDSFILFVDDGSQDQTWNLIKGLTKNFDFVKGIKLSKNFGHQNALLAGLMKVKDISDISITIDADLQQDETAMERFIDKYNEGNDIVYGIRKDRRSDNLFKKISSGLFYSLMSIWGVRIIRNHADYRLISSRVLNTLADYEETNLFLRGILTSIGFKTATVTHIVRPRSLGKSKYSLMKMFSLALTGITSFSIIPIRIVSFIGFFIFLFSILMGIYVLWARLEGKAIVGWASTVLPIYFIGGVQLLCLGMIGEYIGKIYGEVKRRPRYIIEEES